MEDLDPRDLLVRLGDEEVLVLDCREEEDWECYQLHIPGALRMTLHELSESSHSLPDDELIVLCGASPDGGDARRAARLLRMRGRQAVTLSGGIQAWITAGYPVERHQPEMTASAAPR